MNLYHNKYGNICLDFVCVAYYLSQVFFISTLGTHKEIIANYTYVLAGFEV